MKVNIKHLHIELSSKCTLKCPRCPRTELYPTKFRNKEISLETFKKAFPQKTLNSIISVMFEGDLGDPIYATELVEICEYIKANSTTQIKITTNGSWKKQHWWKSLGSVLTENDVVTFSVDGWDQTSNEKYRVNCNFDSIVMGAKTLRETSKCGMIWKSIYFSYNEDYFDKILQVATSLEFDVFDTVQSTKFDNQYIVDGIDPLKPTRHFTEQVFQHDYINISGRDITIHVPSGINVHPWAKCLNHLKTPFITSTGHVFPCPWFDSGYIENPFANKYKDIFNINERPLEEIFNDPLWNEFTDTFKTGPLEICKLKCVK
jgi:MoaA/NifB/PqqE/SkfB family radical SAM enzyme